MKSKDAEFPSQNSEVRSQNFEDNSGFEASYPESWLLTPGSSVKGIGIDIAPISRITKLVSRYDKKTLTLVFTPNEIAQCESSSHPYRHYAVCFSTKEAVGKAIGTGLVDINWNEIEATLQSGVLAIKLDGEAQRRASKCGIQQWLATWCHWDDYVLVHVLAQ